MSSSSAASARVGAHNIIAEIRGRCRTYQQADAAERLIRTLSRVQARKGDRIDLTWRQLARALQLPTEGLTDRQCRNRYRGSIYNTIGYLIDWGYIVSREPVYEANREGRCILITLSAGVAQSVRATRSRLQDRLPRSANPHSRTHVRKTDPPNRSSISGQVCTPRGGLQGGGDSIVSSRPTVREAAARSRELGTRDRAVLAAKVRAALRTVIVVDLQGTETTGAGVLAALPWLQAVPFDVVAREAWRAAGHADVRCSLGQLPTLLAAAGQLERAGYTSVGSGPAASRAAIIDLALGDWQSHWHIRRPSDRPPQTLGGLSFCLRRVAHPAARGARLKRRARRERERARG